jgi:hypothetical protein
VIENEPEYAAYAKEMLELIVGAHNERKKAIRQGLTKFTDDRPKFYGKQYDMILKSL